MCNFNFYFFIAAPIFGLLDMLNFVKGILKSSIMIVLCNFYI